MEKTKLSIPFSLKEYENRLEKTKMAMREKNIEVLFLEDPSNMAWLTGYDGWSFYVHQGVIITLDDLPIWWGRAMDANGARVTVYMDDDHVLEYSDDYIQSTTQHPMEDLAKFLIEKGYANSNIGVELDNYYFSAKAYLCLTEKMNHANFVDATGLVNWQRLIKSDEELVFIKKAASISEKVVSETLKAIEPGMRKNELVTEIYHHLIKGVGEDWGDYPAIVPLLPSGYFASAPHLTWDDGCFTKGEGTFIELSGCYKRYHAPLCRTIFLGEPDERFLNAEKALQEGIENGMKAATAGARACDISKALYGSLAKYNIEREGRCGYSVGLSYPPDWGERTVSIRNSDQTILKPNMVLHFMPGLWMDGWGFEITETIIIQESGPALALSNVERKLFVKN